MHIANIPYWLALLTAPGIKRSLAKRVIYAWSFEDGKPLATLFDQPPAMLAERMGITAQEASELLAVGKQAPAHASALRELSGQGVRVVTRIQDTYPEALEERLPEDRLPYALFYRGNLEVVTQPGVAVCGGAAPTDETLAMTRELAQGLREDGHHLVGGYARGVDRAALDAARDAGASTTLVLPLGIRHFMHVFRSMESALDEGRLLALSPYPSDMPYDEGLAEARLPLILALSAVLVVVAPELEPAEWPASQQALGSGMRVLAWQGDASPQTAAWIGAGAQPFEDAAGCRALVAEWLGSLRTPPEAAASGAAEGGTEDEVGEPPEPVAFEDAEQAIETLGRTGSVPETLARRLREREATWGEKDDQEEEEA